MYSLLSFKSSKLFDCQPFKRYSILAVAIITLLFTDICSALLKIKSLSIPRLVENGTEDSVILDCEYTMDRNDEPGLVVKWFLNGGSEPIYQFIAEHQTHHGMGRFSNKLDLDYAVNEDRFKKFRALSIKRPTIDMSGRYKCNVGSYQSEDEKEESMIVFATPKEIEFSYKPVTPKEVSAALKKDKTYIQSDASYSNDKQEVYSSSSTELQCKVNNVYPIPELSIYRLAQDGTRPTTFNNSQRLNKLLPNGAYNASVSIYINDRNLIEKFGNKPSIFECLVLFNELNKEKKKRIEYIPVNEEMANLSAESNLYYTTFTIVFTLIYLCFKLNMNEL